MEDNNKFVSCNIFIRKQDTGYLVQKEILGSLALETHAVATFDEMLYWVKELTNHGR